MLLRAALIGLGSMGKNHARVLASLDGVKLAVMMDENVGPPSPSVEAAFMTSVNQLEVGTVDFAVVATPTITHESTVLELLDRGIHVLVEKPIADTSGAGRRMALSAREKKLVGAVGHIERFNPAIQELKKRLLMGEIGEVYQIATRRQGSFPHRIGDVGVVKDLATHDIDLTAWIANSSYDCVFAQTAFKSGRQHEDMVSVIGRLQSGVIVNHVVNWLSPMKERVVVVTGDKGSFVADTLTGDLTLHENGAFDVQWENFASFRGVTEGNVTRYAFPKKEPLRAELEAFCAAVSGDDSNFVSFSEGVEVLRVAEAILHSSKTQTIVTLGNGVQF